MFSSTLLVIVLLLLVIWLWESNMRAKESALRGCNGLCKTHDLQLLDDTIALKKISLKRGKNGAIAFYRVYAFEYNTDGQNRRVGELSLLGNQVVNQGLFSTTILTKTPDAQNDIPRTVKSSNNVVDFREYKAQNDDKTH
jgi:hypothetical protein